VPFPISGGCQCARIRYLLLRDPITVYACHCTDCQTATGSSYALSMYVVADDVEITSGAVTATDFSLPDGRSRQFFGCTECATVLWVAPEQLPTVLCLQPGNLDDTTWFYPVGHIWVRSAQPWVRLAPSALCFDTQPDDPGELVRAWKERDKTR
jgi:hypothetical protein